MTQAQADREATEREQEAEALEKEADAVIGRRIAEQLPDVVRAASESFKHVDNLTALNGAQGISAIISQVIGPARRSRRPRRRSAGRTGAQPAEKSVEAP